jgi:UDP-N-acetylmuramate: L-alanyl-gamma-D-glutamyl-meso-diaminopimelate ligase
MRIHILGICGTFMGSLALLAKQLGHQVSGSDQAVYPPMSSQLEQQGIACHPGYLPEHLEPAPDLVIIGNAMSRGNPAVESVLNRGLRYTSGPQWLAEEVLHGRWVLAVAGTHGKTTTSAMLAWILDYAGLEPGFLIGGVPRDFGVSARLGASPFFVVEADEYDTAFFDKRSKFVHYRPRTLIMNNLEYDHADIFPDLAAIERQFHHLVRTVPGQGLIVANADQPALDRVFQQGCWTRVENFSGARGFWQAKPLDAEGGAFEVWAGGVLQGRVNWELIGGYNRDNALAAIAAARHAGVPPSVACEALGGFHNVKRRLEIRGTVQGVTVYDDFAHHPTAIRLTLAALRARIGPARLIAVLEPRSNTMRLGVHRDTLLPSLEAADLALIYQPPGLNWQLAADGERARVFADVAEIIAHLCALAKSGDHVLIMSNGGFDNLHARLLDALAG